MLTKDEILRWVKKAYRFCNNRIIWGLLILGTILAVVIDVLPIYQLVLWILERTGKNIMGLYKIGVSFFDYEIGVLIAIMVVVWTFMVGLSSIFIDKIDNRFYGIRIAYVIEQYAVNLIWIVIMAIMQLVLMVLGAVFELRVTLFMVFLWLLNTMIVLFLFVLINFFKTTILDLLKKEVLDVIAGKKEFEDALVLDELINNLDYKKKEEINIFKSILLEPISKLFGENKEKTSNQRFLREERRIYDLAYKVTCEILDDFTHDSAEMKNKLGVIEDWFYEKEGFLVQAGILSALMDLKEEKNIAYCNQWLKGVERDEECRKLRIWVITYELYKALNIGQEWRAVIAELMFQEYIRDLTEEDEKSFIYYWQSLNGIGTRINVLFDFFMKEIKEYG